MIPWGTLWQSLQTARPQYASVRAMAEAIGVSDETLGRWLEHDAPRRVSRDNLKAVRAWYERTAPHAATSVAESKPAYLAAVVRPQDVDGVLVAVEAMSRTISELTASVIAARAIDEDLARAQAVRRRLAQLSPDQAAPSPAAPADAERRQAGGRE